MYMVIFDAMQNKHTESLEQQISTLSRYMAYIKQIDVSVSSFEIAFEQNKSFKKSELVEP